MKKHKEQKNWRYLVNSAAITFLTLFLFAGCAIAENNTQRVGFGQDKPVVALIRDEKSPCAIEMNVFSRAYRINLAPIQRPAQAVAQVTESVARRILDLLQ
jgi:hypothetical protein